MKKFILAAMLLVLSICLCACDSYSALELYPYDKADRWYCEDIDFTINFLHDENGILLGDVPLKLVWNGQEYTLYIGFHVSYYSLRISDGEGGYEDRVSGNWEYREDNLVLRIKEDLIFDGAFEELVFVPQP